MAGKTQIVDGIVARGATRTAATAALDAVLAEITAALAAGERVTLTGFGTFEAVARAERSARNPRTGATVTVAATTVARFHPGTALRDAVAAGDAPRPAVDLSGLDASVTGNGGRRATAPVADAPAPAADEVPAPVADVAKAAKGAAGKAAKAAKAKVAKSAEAAAAATDGKKVKVAKADAAKAKTAAVKEAKAKTAAVKEAKAKAAAAKDAKAKAKAHDKAKAAKKAKDAKSKAKSGKK